MIVEMEMSSATPLPSDGVVDRGLLVAGNFQGDDRAKILNDGAGDDLLKQRWRLFFLVMLPDYDDSARRNAFKNWVVCRGAHGDSQR